jgi:putative ABC transport system permease protein
VRIAGVWQAKDVGDPYWFRSLRLFFDDLLVPEETYFNYLVGVIKDDVSQAVWYQALDNTSFHASDVPAFIERLARVDIQVGKLLRGTFLEQSPHKLLQDYQKTTNLLTFSLLAFSVPVAALLLAFINLVSSVMVDRQRNEIAVMRSRGATLFQILGISALEGLLLVGSAWLIGIPVSKGIIYLMGKTRSFMDFSLPPSLRLDITSLAMLIAGGAGLLILASRLLPVIGAARQTIITYKQESARTLRAPWWQRIFLDLMLFIPAAYGTYLLRKQGSLVLAGSTYNDPFQNPLLLLIPALGIFSITLFILRLLPHIMTGVAWLAEQLNALSLLLAVRHLARAPGFYSVPLMLLVLTLSLSAFTATLAQTVDTHYHDQQYYYTGSDVFLIEYGQCLKYNQVGQCDVNAATDESPTWNFLPVSVHLKAPGVQAAARVGSWTARANAGGGTQTGRFIGIDRIDFPKVAFWRKDFATDSLGALMNDLAFSPDGVLVPRDYMAQQVLNVGDILTLNVDIGDKSYPMDVTIVGSFDLFPTWYPDKGPLFVGNLDYFFMQTQGQHLYNVWLKTDNEVNCPPLVETLQNPADLGLDVKSCISARQKIIQEQKRPEHQGLFGLLSIGFASAAVFTVLGFLLYALFSFQRRFIEMGVLRAIGISYRQMTSFLAWELGLLIGIGAAAGTALGLFVSRLFIPYLQLGANAAAQVPPFVVQIAWGRIFQIYALFGLLFVVALFGLARLLARMKVFQAIKLGETA